MKKIFVVLLFLLLSTSFVFAEDPELETYRNARADRVECHANFNIEVAQSLIAIRPDTADTLNANIDEVNTEVAALKASAPDATGFNNNSVEAWAAIADLRIETRQQRNNSANRPYTLGEFGIHAEDYVTALENFVDCRKEALVLYADARVASYERIIARLTTKVDELEEKGVDVTEGRQILSDAQTEIVTPLKTAVEAAETPEAVLDALKGYCLYNGCLVGKNFHLSAKLNLARLRTIASFLEDAGADATDLADARTDIAESQAVLDGVGDSIYGAGDSLDILDAAEDAASKLRQINKDIGSSSSTDSSGGDTTDDDADTNTGTDGDENA